MLSPKGQATYGLDCFSDSDNDNDENKNDDNFGACTMIQSYPPLSSYIHAGTASTSALLQYREPREHYNDDDDDDDDDDDSYDDEQDEAEALWQRLAQQQTYRLTADSTFTSPPPTTKPIPSWSLTNSKIQQRMQLERQRMEQDHLEAQKAVKGLVYELDMQVASIMKTRQAEEDALRKIQEEERLRQDIKAQQVAKEQQQQEQLVKEEQVKQESKKAAVLQRKKDKETKSAQATEYVTKAKKLVGQLVQVRQSIEPFDKNKAVSKRRLGMKKIVRGKVNTLSENATKIQEVAMEVSHAITVARTEDEQIKQGLEQKQPGLTSDMARGKRYLIDLLAANTIQRVQADGFNGPRGDGFPLAAMLAMVSLENKELVPILAAHIYTVCPTAIPTLPTPTPDASEDELMSSLGMLKDKNGEYEPFDKFLTRTEVRSVASCLAIGFWILDIGGLSRI
jgi:hypothetical protein